MKVFQRFFRYINPKIDPDVQHHMDRYSMRSIYYASIAVFVVETLLFLYALLTNLGSMNQSVITSLISVGSCVVMCFVASLLSSWSLRKKNLSQRTDDYYSILAVSDLDQYDKEFGEATVFQSADTFETEYDPDDDFEFDDPES